MMQTSFEGILMRKTPVGERNLMGSLLLRNGKKVSVLFYGGMGGGKKNKVSGLELGNNIQVELNPSKKRDEQVFGSREWGISWQHQKIRDSHQKFFLLCFYLEFAQALAQEAHLQEFEATLDSGLFSVVANGIFRLEKLEEKLLDRHRELLIFLAKTAIEQGIFPELRECCFCGEENQLFQKLFLISEHGGFCCPVCLGSAGLTQKQSDQGRSLWQSLHQFASQKYHLIPEKGPDAKVMTQDFLNYLLFQFHMRRDQFKTLGMIL